MSKSKHMDGICGAATVLMVLVTVLVLGGGGTFLQAAAAEMPYVQKIFDTSKVHTVDIVASQGDWESMLENATAEEYIPCTLVIDGERYSNVAIRPKGNSSLSTVASSDSDRYSFKVEFDHYDRNTTYHGLDKLCLNNVIQDNTYLKDYLCYQMMNALGADAPLSSYVWITVNGEDWGLYIAAEGVEEAFAQRVYGSDYGQIYKPDSMGMGGGGRGAEAKNGGEDGAPGLPAGAEIGGAGQPPDDPDGEENAAGEKEAVGKGGMPGGFGGGGMGGSDDVLLVYTDNDPESYSNIFDNAVFADVSSADQDRLIEALKKMNEGDIQGSVNIDEVLRYFTVHNFVLNGDSYTGSIIHNYYLYENGGLLSMIAWDYNLAFGGMGMGAGKGGTGSSGATATVNSPIDSPVTSGDLSERPMVAWIFSSETYTQQYHAALDEFLTEYFESGSFETMIDETIAMISPYVEKDPTAFCTYEEFQKGAETLKEFCLLRAESVRGQLDGSIPSTSEGQSADSSSLIDASHINVSDMGSQGGGMGGGDFFGGKGRSNDNAGASEKDTVSTDQSTEAVQDGGESVQRDEEPALSAAGPGASTGDPTQEGGLNWGGTPPEGMEFPAGAGPQGMTPPGETTGQAETPSVQEKQGTDATGTARAPEASVSSAGPDPTEGSGTQEKSPNETGEAAEGPAPDPGSREEGEAPQAAFDTGEQEGDPPATGEMDRTQGRVGRMQMPGGFSESQAQAQDGSGLETWLLLGGSGILLLGGLLFAKFFR